MKMTPEQNKVQIEVNRANILGLKETSERIYLQVSNHLPTSIKALDDRMDIIEVKIAQLIIKMSVIITIISFAIQKLVD